MNVCSYVLYVRSGCSDHPQITIDVFVSLRRAALEKWKQSQGSSATYRNLIAAFERAGRKDYADTVRTIASKCPLHVQPG